MRLPGNNNHTADNRRGCVSGGRIFGVCVIGIISIGGVVGVVVVVFHAGARRTG